MLHAIEVARQIALLALAVGCVYTDLARGKLYNAATIGGLALGLATAYLLDARSPGLPNLKEAVLAATAGGGLLFVIYLLGGLGAGDVKFMAAVGALAPLRPGPAWGFVRLAMMYAALIGAAVAVGILIWQGRLLQGLKDSARTFVTFRAKKAEGAPATTVPYGLAIGVGTVWAWIETMV